MKKIFKYIALALTAVGFAACTPEYPEVTEANLPQASSLKVRADVDQATNYVTLTMENQGVVPMWIIPVKDRIDDEKGKNVTGKNYALLGNGRRLRFRDAGKHSIEVKAYSSSGVSVGSQILEFELNNTYHDPFDASPYIKALSNGSSQTWEWNYLAAGHFGCGDVAGVTGLTWWSAGANEKKDWSMYDDKISFTSDGKVTYNPGDGKLYVNKGSGIQPEKKTEDADYLVDIDVTEGTYSVESRWNDAGIEEIHLIVKGAPLSYAAAASELTEADYLILEHEPAQIKKCLKLAVKVVTNDNPDGIVWHKEFVKEGSNAANAEPDPLFGKTSKTWVLDLEAVGHLGCGPNQDNPAGWWAAAEGDKSDTGVADDEITFFADGKYTFNPGADGKVYINKDVTVVGPGTAASEDYDINWALQESTYSFDGEVIKFPEGVIVGYIANNEAISNPTYVVKELTANKLVIVGNYSGISWQYIYKPKGGEVENPSASLDANSDANIFKGKKAVVDYWYSASDWSGALHPEITELEGGKWSVKIPEGIGGAEWQGQTKFHFDVPASASKAYDFGFKVTPSVDCEENITVKFAWEGHDNDHAFFYVNNFSAAADETTAFVKTNVKPDVDYDKVVLFVDLGRCPAGATLVFSEFCFQEHK